MDVYNGKPVFMKENAIWFDFGEIGSENNSTDGKFSEKLLEDALQAEVLGQKSKLRDFHYSLYRLHRDDSSLARLNRGNF